MMSLTLFLLLGLLLARDGMEHARLQLVMERDWIRDQARSVAVLLEENEELLTKEEVTRIFHDIPVQVKRISEAWGLFNVEWLISETAHLRDTTLFLCGNARASEDSTALYFPGEAGNYLSVAGETELRGVCYLPPLGARKGYVQGRGYYKDSVVYGEIRQAGKELPRLSSAHVERWERFTRVEESEELVLPVDRSFTTSSMTFYSLFPVTLSAIQIKGHARVVSAEKIEVDSSSLLYHCLLVAPVIKIHKGFAGKVQLFASDTIVIDSNATLLYPSVVYLNASGKGALIETRRGATVAGVILITGEEEPLYLMHPGSVLHGQLYNSGVTQLEGTVYGPAYLRKTRFYNEQGEHENIIRDGIIDNGKPAGNRPCLDLFQPGTRAPVMEVVW
ncbi:MAG: hypothetical protein LBP56_01190 [Odoribacteraceae bacterium]|nr:hypothetical protein [Odoribacteraceae bacterium]